MATPFPTFGSEPWDETLQAYIESYVADAVAPLLERIEDLEARTQIILLPVGGDAGDVPPGTPDGTIVRVKAV